jgi:PAS domain S-box-containing protein/putative nucleotidyltransferase with HDIG domain
MPPEPHHLHVPRELFKQLADSERLFRAVVDLTNDGVWMTDGEAKTIFVTERMAGMLGYRPSEMIGRPAIDFVAPDYRDRFRGRFARRREGVTEAGRNMLEDRHGQLVPVTVAATPIEDDEGRFVGAVALVTDERDAMPVAPEAIRLAEGLAIAASLREGVPPSHCAEVADLAARTAARMGLDGGVIVRARLGGWLHDVGKLAVPDVVLEDAQVGRLTNRDRLTLRRHAEFGAAIVAGVPSLADAADAVRHHHERVDGTGYPAGLEGAAIPIEARIVAAADAYSAITQGRPYQQALDHERAVAQLRATAAASLDPAVVEALVGALEGTARAA